MLLSVLLATALFAAVAAGLAVRSRVLAMQAANREDAIRAQSLVDGAALFALDALRPPPARPPDGAAIVAAAFSGRAVGADAPPVVLPIAVDGTSLACPLAGGGRMEISAVDQGALLDLNGASVPMLRDVLAAAGLDGETARRLADEIADFRDPDDAPQNNGIGERAQYRERGLSWEPANAPFTDAGEIAQLPGATPQIVARLSPLLTVANPRSAMDLALAGAAAMRRLPPDAAKRPELSRWNLASPRTDFAIQARFRRSDGSVAASRHLLASFSGSGQRAPRIGRWSRPPEPEDTAISAEGATDTRFCAALSSALGEVLRR